MPRDAFRLRWSQGRRFPLSGAVTTDDLQVLTTIANLTEPTVTIDPATLAALAGARVFWREEAAMRRRTGDVANLRQAREVAMMKTIKLRWIAVGGLVVGVFGGAAGAQIAQRAGRSVVGTESSRSKPTIARAST